jgi:lipoprotein-anchoring transpeptidase ErfK/SrfK
MISLCRKAGHRVSLAAVLVLGLLFATGCTTAPPDAYPPQAFAPGPPVDDVSFWDGDHLTGPVSVRIVLSQQRAYLYKGGQLAGVSLISSGSEGMNTVTGTYKLLEKDRHHASSLYGNYVDENGQVIQRDVDTRKDPKPPGARYEGADMPYWMRIVGGTGMHEGFLPGYPASHGCIRMPGFMAAAFFRNVSVGTPVVIEP